MLRGICHFFRNIDVMILQKCHFFLNFQAFIIRMETFSVTGQSSNT